MNQSRLLSILVLTALCTLCAACSDSTSQTAETAASTAPPAAAPAASTAAPEGPATAAAVTGGGETILAPGAQFKLPAGWEQEQPESQMRLAQARIPGSGGAGQLTVFYFGPGGGGGTEDNLQRWIGQVEATSEPTRDSFTLGTWKVTWIEVAGTLKPSSMGVGPTGPQPGSRLLGAVVEGEGGPWFFKATGPDATIQEQRDAFLALLKSGEPHA